MGEHNGILGPDDSGVGVSLKDIIEGLEDELLVVDTRYRVRLANKAARGRFRREEESPLGRLCYEVFHDRDSPCAAPLWDCPLRLILRTGRKTAVLHPVRVDGGDTYLKLSAHPLYGADGKIKAVVELRRDVTAERELEAHVLRRHHQLLALSHISRAISGLYDLDAILNIALDNVLEIVNATTGGVLLLDENSRELRYHTHRGLSAKYAEEMHMTLGEGIAGRVAESGRAILVDDVSTDPRAFRPDLLASEGIKGFVSIPLQSKGRVFGVMNLLSHTFGRFGSDDLALLTTIGDYLGTAIEQAKLYERLKQAGDRYRSLLRHALTAQEEERKRIARELHDETSQALTSLSLNLQALITVAELENIGGPEFLERLRRVYAISTHASNETLKLMKELRPTLLNELGLAAAINQYTRENLQSQGIEVSTEFRGADQRLGPEVEIALFRIAQGAVGNILEHSGARNASVTLNCEAGTCTLRVEDDGRGFEVGKVTAVDPSGRGAGVLTMKERVRLVGGSCHIESEPGQGTRVVVTVPYDEELRDEEDQGTRR